MTLFHIFFEVIAIIDNARLNHLTQQVVTFTCTFTDTGEYGESVVLLGNVVD